MGVSEAGPEMDWVDELERLACYVGGLMGMASLLAALPRSNRLRVHSRMPFHVIFLQGTNQKLPKLHPKEESSTFFSMRCLDLFESKFFLFSALN